MNRHLSKLGATAPAMAGTPARIVASACVIGLLAGIADFAILTLLAYLGFSRVTLRIHNAAVTGAVTAGFLWAVLVAVSLRRRYFHSKLQVVADLNHELRNALEVILQSSYLPNDQRHSALLDSAERIDKALSELLAEARVSGSQKAYAAAASREASSRRRKSA
jgi:signal transduction histidine kinase